jgi:hypothetical protein
MVYSLGISRDCLHGSPTFTDIHIPQFGGGTEMHALFMRYLHVKASYLSVHLHVLSNYPTDLDKFLIGIYTKSCYTNLIFARDCPL